MILIVFRFQHVLYLEELYPEDLPALGGLLHNLLQILLTPGA